MFLRLVFLRLVFLRLVFLRLVFLRQHRRLRLKVKLRLRSAPADGVVAKVRVRHKVRLLVLFQPMYQALIKPLAVAMPRQATKKRQSRRSSRAVVCRSTTCSCRHTAHVAMRAMHKA